MNESAAEIQAVIVRYMPYLQEIRRRILLVVSVFLVGAILGFIYFEPIVKAILSFYHLNGLNIVFTSPFQFMNLAINSGFIVGFVLAFPLILYQLLTFLKPALKPREYRLLLSSVPISIVLFVVGFGFGTWIMKFVVEVFSKQSTDLSVQNVWDIQSFLGNIFMTSLLLGIIFQFPVVLTAALRLKVLRYQSLVKARIPVLLGLIGFTVMLPPTDILSNVLIFLPLAFLFEMTLLFNRSNKTTIQGVTEYV